MLWSRSPGALALRKLASQPVYHGTNETLPMGSRVKPSAESGKSASEFSNLAGDDDIEHHTYATSSLGNAANYGRLRAAEHGGETRVYHVHPEGDTEPDPLDPLAIRSRKHMKVLREVPEEEWAPAFLHYYRSRS
jgi:hypothetical protein